MKPPASSVPRQETIRSALRAALEKGPVTARELSGRVRISEKDVAGHLEHLARSLAARGESLQVEAALCLACGYRFEGRKRFTRPSRCPKCQAERIDPPAFSIASRP